MTDPNRCWCRHAKRWHQHGVCVWCARNERRGTVVLEHADAPPRHPFATEEPEEVRAAREKWFEGTFGRKPRQPLPLEIIERSQEEDRRKKAALAKVRCWCGHLKRWHRDGVCEWCARNPARDPYVKRLPHHEFGGEAELRELAREWYRRVGSPGDRLAKKLKRPVR